MPFDGWIEVGHTFEEQVQLKKTVLRDHRDLVSIKRKKKKKRKSKEKKRKLQEKILINKI